MRRPDADDSLVADVALDATCTWDAAEALTVEAGYGVLDTAATLNLIGAETLDALRQWLIDRELPTEISEQPCSRTFRFGDYRTLVANKCVTLPLSIGGRTTPATIYIVPCWAPLLLARPLWDILGLILPVRGKQFRFSDVPGMPWLPLAVISSFPSCHRTPRFALRRPRTPAMTL